MKRSEEEEEEEERMHVPVRVREPVRVENRPETGRMEQEFGKQEALYINTPSSFWKLNYFSNYKIDVHKIILKRKFWKMCQSNK